MRPILLTFNGCRSYVEPQTIDFAGKQFVAIVGDTGSGKSTVLDAICYGLYNRCSWRGGIVSDLVAHGGDGTLSVEFTFSVGDKVWRVERSTTPRAAAPAHKLVDVDTGAVVATGAHAVTAQVRRIVGLDYDTFLRAVVLPQGRFHELLRMGDTDRSKILKSVLGLDQLGAVRGHAQALHARLALRLSEYRERRALFLPDPGKTLAEATERLRVAQERLDLLQAAQDAVAAAKAAAATALGRKTDLERARGRLTRAMPDQPDTRYQAMLTAAAELTARQQEIERRRAEAVGEQQTIEGQLDGAERHGTGVAAVASTLSTLTVLANQLPQVDAQAMRLRTDEQEIQSAHTDLDGRKAALAELEKSVASAKGVLDGAMAGLSAAEDADTAARDVLAGYGWAAEAAGQADERVAACEADVQKLRAAAHTAAAEAEKATETVVEREGEQARSVRRHAAAIAGAGCVPGDPCPVCSQSLPANFTAPADEATKAIDAAVRAARTAAAQAAERATAAAERARIAEQDTLATAMRLATDAAAALSQARTRVYEVLGEVDLDAPDGDLLRPFNDAVATVSLQHTAADDAFRDAQAAHLQAASELPVREQALAARLADHQRATADHDKTVAALHDAAHGLPPAFRLAGDVLSLAEIGRTRATAEQRQHELTQLTDRLATARDTLDQLQAAQQQLDDERAERVTRPASTLRRQLDRLIDRAADVEALLKVPLHPSRPADSALADEAAWCTAMLAHTENLVTACTQQADQARLAAAAADEAAQQARRGCGADNDTHLEQLVRLASTASHNASRDIAKATAHQPLADELDRRINTAAPTVAALADLFALLADGKFIADAVRQRQLALLGAASQTLLTITGGRFGFADNFRIIDTDTAQPRDVRTLSGGETFQASLALALAVVELASRACGRVDSLFLDEGFGSLDSGVLRDALNALAAHSTAGRMVTVISHMRSITENADHVLVVKRSFAGSRAHWATPDEREQIINDDLGRGQLT